MARTPTLQMVVDADQNRAGRLLLHPMQRRARDQVVELLDALPRTSSLNELFEFQHVLAERSCFIAEAASQLRRGQARAAKGKMSKLPAGWQASEEPSSEEQWLFELTVADRLVRQLRSVGDALAWKVFRYDRRVIIALSSNAMPSPLAGKAGLDAEWAAVVDARERGNFALMHDLTSVLRISDLTEFTRDGRVLKEIKSSEGATTSAQALRQKRRAQQALASLEGGRLPGSDDDVRFLYQSTVPLRTHLPDLDRLCRNALADGWAVAHLKHGLVVSVFDMWSAAQLADPVELLAGHNAAVGRIKARLSPAGKHEIRVQLVDLAARDPGFVPASLYPLPVDVRAGLICDDIVVTITQDLDAIKKLLEKQGLRVKVLLPDAPGDLNAPTFQVWEDGGSRTLTVHGRSLAQKLIELVDSGVWAQAAAALVRDADLPQQPVVVYANERGVWGRST